jgi:hypothetical protein
LIENKKDDKLKISDDLIDKICSYHHTTSQRKICDSDMLFVETYVCILENLSISRFGN